MSDSLAELLQTEIAKCPIRHQLFRKSAIWFLRQVWSHLESGSEKAEIEWLNQRNRIAGEARLFSKSLFISITQRWPEDTTSFLVRNISDRQSWQGGQNLWLADQLLDSPFEAALEISRILGLRQPANDLISLMTTHENDNAPETRNSFFG
ncbi:hypothetical protein PbB2_02846 [Candidatus Phycosocius bacilliformis]|uniref:Uncharacterized protein n=1 Tax=Candidatus Phycosocius bacilliformis TaxID=1445552 RepID=A0A2P2EDM0_9PROT|nr:hypothetical protein [Candidatus Phycosocius bacilliformis]GBF59154.1 hypothetical protein PbB2_02846 [Candidatus Phycosocius bacilliformis]